MNSSGSEISGSSPVVRPSAESLYFGRPGEAPSPAGGGGLCAPRGPPRFPPRPAARAPARAARAATAPASVTVAPASVAVAAALVQVLVVGRVHVGDVQEAVAADAEIDERGLDTRLDVDDPALVNVADV